MERQLLRTDGAGHGTDRRSLFAMNACCREVRIGQYSRARKEMGQARKRSREWLPKRAHQTLGSWVPFNDVLSLAEDGSYGDLKDVPGFWHSETGSNLHQGAQP